MRELMWCSRATNTQLLSDDKREDGTTIDKYYLSDHTFRYAKLGTRNDEYQYEGIKIVDLADWLLEI